MNEPPDKRLLLAAYNAEAQRLQNAPPVTIEIWRLELMCLIAAVQLACRHPKYRGKSRDLVENMMRQLEWEAFKEFPAVRAIVARGWDKNYDDPIPE